MAAGAGPGVEGVSCLHELGLLMEIVKTVEKFTVENKVGRIEKLVLQIGEISSVIPEYMKKVYPAR